MNPKLLRHYSNILNEAAYQTGAQFMASRPPAAQPAGPAAGTAAATRAGQGSGAAKPTAPLPSNPNAPGYKVGPGGPAKIGTQNFNSPAKSTVLTSPTGSSGGAPKPSAAPAAPNYGAAVKSANAAFAANQAKAPQGDQTAGGKTNAAFLPGAAGGAAPAAASTAAAPTPAPAPQNNALGIAPQANIQGSPTGPAAEPKPTPQANALGIAPQANVPQFGATTNAAPDAATSSASRALPITTSGGPTAANPTSVNPPTQGGPQVTGSANMTTDSDDVIAKRGPMGIQMKEEELEEDNELSELMRLSGRPMNKPKVSESVMLEAGSTLEHIIKKFKHETKNFLAGNDLDSDLYDALYDYYSDNGEIPYGVAKARDGDPYQWVSNRFADEMQMHGYSRQADMLNMPGQDHELTELARLAGLSEDRQPFRTPEIGSKLASSDVETFGNKSGRAYSLEKNKDGNWDISNQDKKDHIRSRLGKHVKPTHLPEGEINECGDMVTGGQEDSMNVSTNMDSSGKKSVSISAQGDRADALLQMLKMAGMRPHDDHDEGHEEVVMIGAPDEMMDEEYANEPEQEYETIDSIIRQGNDLNREKRQYADQPKLGDNPMAETTGDEKFDSMMGQIAREPKVPDMHSDMPPTSIPELLQWAELNNKPYHHGFAQWAKKNRFTNVNDALEWFGDNVDPDNEWEDSGEFTIDAARHDRRAAELMKAFKCYEEIYDDWDDDYRQMNMPEGVALDEELQNLLDSILVREEMTDVLKAEQPYKDEKTGKMVTPPKGATMPPADTPPAPKVNVKK